MKSKRSLHESLLKATEKWSKKSEAGTMSSRPQCRTVTGSTRLAYSIYAVESPLQAPSDKIAPGWATDRQAASQWMRAVEQDGHRADSEKNDGLRHAQPDRHSLISKGGRGFTRACLRSAAIARRKPKSYRRKPPLANVNSRRRNSASRSADGLGKPSRTRPFTSLAPRSSC